MKQEDLYRFFAYTERTEVHGCLFWTGGLDSHGYGRFVLDGKKIGAHKALWEHTYGPVPDGKELDHVMCFRHDCVEPSHLRPVTKSQNMQNRQGAASHSQSGVRGVMWDAAKQRWRVQVRVEGKTKTRYLHTQEEAKAVVIELRSQMTTHPDLGAKRAS